jgi:hypothetical protein
MKSNSRLNHKEIYKFLSRNKKMIHLVCLIVVEFTQKKNNLLTSSFQINNKHRIHNFILYKILPIINNNFQLQIHSN